MARSFNGSNQYLEYAGVPLSALPCTLACWANCNTTTSPVLMGMGNGSTSSNNALFLQAFTSATNYNLFAQAYVGASHTYAESAGTVAPNTWFHAAATYDGEDVYVYLNGSPTSAVGPTIFPNGMTLTDIGSVKFDNTRNATMQGSIAEAAVWNVALNASEIAALATGQIPARVRPSALVAYWPLFGLLAPEPDLSGNAVNLTLNGSPPLANHAPVTLWTKKARTPCDGFLLPRPWSTKVIRSDPSYALLE